jgi:hypothetical protein
LIDDIRKTRFFCEDLQRTQGYYATVRIHDVKLLSKETADFSPHAITIKSASGPPSDYSLTPHRRNNQLVFQPKFNAFDLRIGVGRTLTCTLWKYKTGYLSSTWTKIDEVEVVDEAGPFEAIGMLLPKHRQTTFKRSIRMAGGYDVLLEFSDFHQSDDRQVPALLWDAALHAVDNPR